MSDWIQLESSECIPSLLLTAIACAAGASPGCSVRKDTAVDSPGTTSETPDVAVVSGTVSTRTAVDATDSGGATTAAVMTLGPEMAVAEDTCWPVPTALGTTPGMVVVGAWVSTAATAGVDVTSTGDAEVGVGVPWTPSPACVSVRKAGVDTVETGASCSAGEGDCTLMRR